MAFYLRFHELSHLERWTTRWPLAVRIVHLGYYEELAALGIDGAFGPHHVTVPGVHLAANSGGETNCGTGGAPIR